MMTGVEEGVLLFVELLEAVDKKMNGKAS